MKEVSLSGSLRENVGKKDATAIRNAERVPAVIYGGKEQIHFSVKHTDLEKLVYTPNVYIINVELDGKNYKTIIQDLQQDPITDIMIHADFIELSDDKKVKVNVPVKLEGRAIGVMNGGKMRQIFRKLKVYAVPGELPDEIVIDVSKLRIGQAIRVRDLNNGLEILNPASAVICSIKTARGAVADEEEEEEGGEEAAAEGAEEAAPAEESAE